MPSPTPHSQPHDNGARLAQIFPGDSEMATRMRAFDWSTSDLGPPEHWPENLRAAVRLCLTSRFPILLWWGPRLALLYNDAYLTWLTEAKHPRALGRPGYECWSEIWGIIGLMMDGVLSTGQATWSVDTELFFDRKVRQEEVYITWTYAPILAADGQTVDGIFNPCVETTEKVIGARRLETLRKLGSRPAEARTVDAASREAVAVLAENTRDIPFAAIYLAGASGNDAQLNAAALPSGEHGLPDSVSVSEDGSRSPWLLAEVLRTKRSVDCTELPAHGVQLPSGPWPELVERAVALPILAAQHQLVGVLVLGASARRPLDDTYRTFLDLVAGHIAVAIADARASEEERRRAEAMAELDRAKTIFFSNVSHEFRTPLTLILGPLDELLVSPRIGPEEREQLEIVRRNAARLQKLVDGLLDFTRAEASRIQVSYEAVDLAELTRDLVSVFRSAYERAGLALIVQCPPLGEPVYVDRELWEKIVLNLVSNAFKFTFEGEVRISLGIDNDRVLFRVRDTGVGIPPEELARVFDRFHRVPGVRSRSHEGSGIGLALVQELAKLHGGSVHVESTPDRGSQFTVALPRGPGHLPKHRIGVARTLPSSATPAGSFVEEAMQWLPGDERATPPAASLGETAGADNVPSPRARAERILVADDNADMRQYIRRLLGPYWAVEAVEDGVKALESARANPPDLVVADVMMPGLDGLELLRLLRQDARTAAVPVIVVSARAAEHASLEGLTSGADDYIVKPFSARELLARIRARLDIARVRREAETRITCILESLTSGFLAYDSNWRVTYMNPAARRLLLADDFDPGAMIGKHLWEDLFPELRDSDAGRQMQKAMTERIPVSFEYHFEPGSRRYDNHVYPLPDGGIAAEFRDVTQRKLAEEQARVLEARFRAMADDAPIIIWVTDPAGANTFVNRAFLEFIGITREESERFDWASAVHPDDRETYVTAFRAALRERRAFRGRMRARRHDGVWRCLETRGHPQLDPAGRLTGFVGCSPDITEMVESQIALEEADRRKDEFLAVLSHELRNPLAAIMIGLRLLRMLGGLSAEAENTREMIERQSGQLSRLVDDLLDVSRVSTGRIALRMEAMDLRDVVNRAIQTTRPLLDERQHQLEVDVPSTALPIEGDPTRLTQALSNLLNNAAKYTHLGGQIRLMVTITGHSADVRITDNGIGIAAEDLPRIFEFFTRIARSQDHGAGGLGIGLTLSRRLVEMHGGSLQAFSEGPDRGSEFLVRLPLALSTGAQERRPTLLDGTSAPAVPRRILLVDDNESFAVAMTSLLGLMGHDVRTVHDGSSAMAVARAFRPHVVLLDIGLPGKDGYEVVREMRAHPTLRTVMVIALTGYGQERDKQNARAAGIDHHLTKPVNDKVLETLIDGAPVE